MGIWRCCSCIGSSSRYKMIEWWGGGVKNIAMILHFLHTDCIFSCSEASTGSKRPLSTSFTPSCSEKYPYASASITTFISACKGAIPGPCLSSIMAVAAARPHSFFFSSTICTLPLLHQHWIYIQQEKYQHMPTFPSVQGTLGPTKYHNIFSLPSQIILFTLITFFFSYIPIPSQGSYHQSSLRKESSHMTGSFLSSTPSSHHTCSKMSRSWHLLSQPAFIWFSIILHTLTKLCHERNDLEKEYCFIMPMYSLLHTRTPGRKQSPRGKWWL